MKNTLLKKIENKQATVGVVGLGYVGLPLLLCYIEKGFKGIGFDIDSQKTKMLNEKKSYIKHISSDRISSAVLSGLFSSETNFPKMIWRK